MPLLRKIAVGMFAGLTLCAVYAQQEPSASARKVISKVVPAYPELARKMNLTGSVKLAVTVSPNGSVRKIEPHGGSPLLVKAAQEAVYKWRWAPAIETTELVELNFHPE
jgi:TonB family protein